MRGTPEQSIKVDFGKDISGICTTLSITQAVGKNNPGQQQHRRATYLPGAPPEIP